MDCLSLQYLFEADSCLVELTEWTPVEVEIVEPSARDEASIVLTQNLPRVLRAHLSNFAVIRTPFVMSVHLNLICVTKLLIL